MAQLLAPTLPSDHSATNRVESLDRSSAAAVPVADHDVSRSRPGVRTALATMVVCILAVQAGTMAMILLMTDVSLLAAVGFGAYCAFWLGGGFGTIFGSAMVFSRGH